jgi:acetolactate synthase-1/2/3 large subunit
MNVAQFVFSIVQRLGTDTAFSLTGGMAMHINRAVGESAMQVIYCNHEQAVAAAADGYAKAKEFQVPGLAVVTSGPGVMNIVNSVASAYYDSVPVIILAGQIKTADINTIGVRSRGAQETPHLDVMKPITKCAFRYIPDQVSDDVLAANMALAMAGRKGPVFIEIPLDIQPQNVEDTDKRIDAIMERISAITKGAPSKTSPTVDAIIKELGQASRPVLVVGNGLHIAGISRDRVRALVEGIAIPTLFTWPSSDLLEHSHDLNFGCAGGLAPTHANKIIQNADVVVFLGVRLDILTTAFNPQNYGKNAKRIIVDCDQKEIDKNTGFSNSNFYCENLVDIIGALERKYPASQCVEWLAQCHEWRVIDQQQEHKAFHEPKLNTYQMSKVLSESSAVKYIVPTGSGFAIEGFARFFKAQKNVSVAWAGHCLGSMGLALPMAIGAAAATHQTVICLEGDGGVLLNVQELFTLAANPKLRLTVIVMNNGGYQSIMKSQTRVFGREFGASDKSGLCSPHFEQLAALVGLPFTRCETVVQFKAAMAQDLGRHFIEVMLQEDGYRGPAVSTKFDANGIPYSTDIGDVSWDR